MMENISVSLSDHLKLYFENKFLLKENNKNVIKADHSVAFWENYLEKTDEKGFEILRRFYPQLNFPIEEGINKSQNFIDAVLKGKSEDLKSSLNLNAHEQITVIIYESIAGKIPVITIPDDEDFTTVIQSLLHKNNPVIIPLSMGAALVNGINNWSRIHNLKNEWQRNNPFGNWNYEFSANILPKYNLYKDRFIIVSTKPYSNVSACRLGISDKDWQFLSSSIRLEHECSHLYTLQKYGCASNNLHDELIADYAGIIKAKGSYNKEWMLQFMGLEEYPKYRKGARLENYFPMAEFSENDFENLITYIKNAIENISVFDEELGKIQSKTDQICRLESLCETNLIQLGSGNGADALIKKYNDIHNLYTSSK